MVNKVLQEAHCTLSALDAIAFTHGPGSFTGVRITTSFVQGLVYSLNIPGIPLSTLRVLAQGYYRTEEQTAVVIAMDARSAGVYWGAYTLKDALMEPLLEDCICAPDNIIIPTQCHTNPLFSDLFAGELVVPSQTTEGIPVALAKKMATPISVRSGIGHTSNTSHRMIV